MVFRVRSVDVAGQLVEQNLDAASKTEAIRMAQRPGWVVLGARERAGRSLGRPTVLDPVAFGRDLSALLRAGISLVESISIIADRQTKQSLGQRLAHVHDRVSQGQRLSAALEADRDLLPLFFTASVRVAETTGHLPEALERYADYQARVDALRGKLSQALIYPGVVSVVGLLVVLFLMLYVVPRFASVFADLQVELPWGSRLLLSIGAWVDTHGAWVVAMLMLLLGPPLAALASPAARGAFQRWMLGLPGIRGPYRVYRLAIFYRNLAMLLQGGVPVPSALAMAAPTLGQGLAESAGSARAALLQGAGVAAALRTHGLTTGDSQRMIQVGERSGRLAAMFESVAELHDAEVALLTERFGRLFEPLVMVVLGVVIGGVVVLLYMPIFDLAGAVG